MTVQMSHPGLIIQTVSSEDLSDPLNQSGLSSEPDLSNEELTEDPEPSNQEGELNGQSSKPQQEDLTDKVQMILSVLRE